MLIDDFLKINGIEQCDKKRTLQVLYKGNSCESLIILNQCIIDNMILIITDLKTYKKIKPNVTRHKLGYFFLNKLSRIKKTGPQYIEFLSGDTESFIEGSLAFNGPNEFYLVSNK